MRLRHQDNAQASSRVPASRVKACARACGPPLTPGLLRELLERRPDAASTSHAKGRAWLTH